MHRSKFASILSCLFVMGACTAGCGGGSGSDPGGGGDEDTGTGTEDSGSGVDGTTDTSTGTDAPDGFVLDSAAGDTTAGDDTTSADSTTGTDTGGGADGTTDGSGTDGAGSDTTSVDGSDGTTGDTTPADTGKVDTGIHDTTPPDPCTAGLTCSDDADGDTIPDLVEGRCASVDTDSDGSPDYIDPDSDNDTVADKIEWAAGGCDETAPLNDADGDGIPNFRDLDSDGNGLADSIEICPPFATLTKLGKPACSAATGYDFDGDGVMDFLDNDNDHDAPGSALEVGLEDKNELVNNAGVYVGTVDTDGDGVPDVYDVDSDNDFIFDLSDGASDTDGDTVPNFRDTDSDGDKVGDACEARNKAAPVAGDLALAVKDTDLDGKPDYLDLDSDSDLLTDGVEDKNFNCIVDSCESSRVLKDTDSDGTDDFVEATLDTGGACWAHDPAKTPANQGKFYFIEPYSTDGSAAPTPTTSLLALSTQLNNGDVGFIMDTTGSMTGEINNLKTSLSSIITSLAAKIPNLGVGVAGHDDLPDGNSGDCSVVIAGRPVDSPWYQPAGYITDVSSGGATIPAGITIANNQVNGLRLAYGVDGPEDQVEALIHGIGGNALNWSNVGAGCPSGSLAADNGDGGVTTFGAFHFRTKALPIIIEISDADFHNGYNAAGSGPLNPYGYVTWNSADLVAKMNSLGAKFIGVAADNGGRASGGPGGNPYTYEAYIADQTGSNVPPSAFGAGSTTCKTGVSGAAIAPDGPGGTCRSVYSCNTSGTGLTTSIVDGVYAILASIKFDVYVQAYNPGATDVVGDFMQKVEPNPAGGTDPVTGSVCVSGIPASQLKDQFVGPKAVVVGTDGVNDTIKTVNPGNYYCFNVVPKPNTVVPATSVAQTFTAKLRVLAQKPTGGTFALGADRDVLFVVPPIVN